MDFLKSTIAINNLCGKIMPINSTLSDTEQSLAISNFDEKNKSGTSFANLSLGNYKATTIDALVKKRNLDIIKMDIKGMELQALSGVKETINHLKSALVISAYHCETGYLKIQKFNPSELVCFAIEQSMEDNT